MNLIAKIHTKEGVQFKEIESLFSESVEVELLNLPEGSNPVTAMRMSDEQIEEINQKTLKTIEEMKEKAKALAKEYCADYSFCEQLVYNDPNSPYLEYQCLKSCGDIKSQWLKCIETKKQKALTMLQDEKKIAEKDGDKLASEEIDSLCELINEIDHTALHEAESEEEILNYWPALLLPAPKMKIP